MRGVCGAAQGAGARLVSFGYIQGAALLRADRASARALRGAPAPAQPVNPLHYTLPSKPDPEPRPSAAADASVVAEPQPRVSRLLVWLNDGEGDAGAVRASLELLVRRSGGALAQARTLAVS